MKHILVTGGAGYIGSITSYRLLKSGYNITILDDLSKGHIGAIPAGCNFFQGCFSDFTVLDKIHQKHTIDAIVHFAAYSLVSESVVKPHLYLQNNLIRSGKLLGWALDNNIKNFVFSSSAGVYGTPREVPIKETIIPSPEHPYGESKLLFEQELETSRKKSLIRYVSLRYFNAAGADLEANLGEDHSPETHLIPNLIKTAMLNDNVFNLYGNDYSTPDGTAVRDYIHVVDLANAHIQALKWLDADYKVDISPIFNVGIGRGFSVMEILEITQKVTGKKIRYEINPRRLGDPPCLVADTSKANDILKWNPYWTNPEEIVRMAYEWYTLHPYGYTS